MSDRKDRSPESYVGGLRWLGGNASWPLVRLVINTEGMRISPSSGLLGVILPRWHFLWTEVVRAERVRGALFGSAGVRFYIKDRQHPFTFWYSKPTRILEALAYRGVPVDHSEHRLKLTET